jgi:hypothetical protein
MQWRMITLGAALCLVAAIGISVDQLEQIRAEQRWSEQEDELERSRMLPNTPQEMLRSLHDGIAQNNTRACGSLMEESARARFAHAHGEPTCEAAITKLSQQVTDTGDYVRFTIDERYVRQEVATGGAFIDGCQVQFGGLFNPTDPGPRLGQFHGHRVIAGGGLLIDGYTPCPPRSNVLAALPSSPTGVGNVLVGYLAYGNDIVCQLFSDSAEAEFAAALNAEDCPEAVARFHSRVTDPDQYARPLGGIWTGPHDLRDDTDPVPVNVCELVWPPNVNRPGPAQVGTLEVTQARSGAGYQITQFRPCDE